MGVLPTIPGFHLRALRLSDASDVTALIAATEREVDDVVLIAIDDVTTAWSRPSFDIESMSIGVEHEGRLIAFGEVHQARAEIEVHPQMWRQGIGTALARWSWAVAAEAGEAMVGQTISDAHDTARRLFVDLGYHERWTSWILRRDMDEAPQVPDLPSGVAMRSIEDGDEHQLYEIVERAFSEWPDRADTSFESWRVSEIDHPASRPVLSPVVEVDGIPVGVAIAFEYDDGQDEGWVQQLAVAKEHRGKGLGAALLAQIFRNFFDAGYRRVGVSTDSRTGALGLYERVGMSIARSFTRWTKSLD